MEEYEELPCSQKMAFDTKRQALDTATTSKHWYGTSLKAYRCKNCQLWHLATETQQLAKYTIYRVHTTAFP